MTATYNPSYEVTRPGAGSDVLRVSGTDRSEAVKAATQWAYLKGYPHFRISRITVRDYSVTVSIKHWTKP